MSPHAANPTRKDEVIPSTASLGVRVLLGLLLVTGFVARVLPFAEPSTRMLRQYPTEDGYLMLTIARNLALGHGMSTADGTIPTNGTQPFATFVYSIAFGAVGADKIAGVAIVLVLQLLAGLATAWLVWRLARRLFADDPRMEWASALAACAWYASAIVTSHGLNCLETGFYGLAVVAFVTAFLARHPSSGMAPSLRGALMLGLYAGFVLWVRIDAVFLLAAACLAWAFLDAAGRIRFDKARFGEAIALGAVASAVLSPWLIHNRVEFGSFMPISGRAESFAAGLGSNLMHLPACLAEYILLVLPIPSTVEQSPAVVALSVGLIAAAIFGLTRLWNCVTPTARTLIAVVGVFASCLSAYYGIVFGAPYFISRYLFPLSVFTAIGWAFVVVRVLDEIRMPRAMFATTLVLVSAALHVRVWRGGLGHMHLQVVEWVKQHVPDDTWVGAVQTGTVGYFHDRTINLDGKVNPEALKAVLARRIPEYVLSKPIQYLTDWEGLAEWADMPEFQGHFELVVHDKALNLAVLKRKDGS